MKTALLLLPFISLALAGCTGKGPSDEDVKSQVWNAKSLTAYSIADYYQMSDYKIVKKDELDGGNGYFLTIEQNAKLTKDCEFSVKYVDGLALCGQQGSYEKKTLKAGKEIKLTYRMNLYKNSNNEFKINAMTPVKVESNLYQL